MDGFIFPFTNRALRVPSIPDPPPAVEKGICSKTAVFGVAKFVYFQVCSMICLSVLV